MSAVADIVAAAWEAWAAWQSEKDDRGGSGHPRTWAAVLKMFRVMDGAR